MRLTTELEDFLIKTDEDYNKSVSKVEKEDYSWRIDKTACVRTI